MLTAIKDAEIFCSEAMFDTLPVSLDGPTAMEDVKIVEEQNVEAGRKKRNWSPFLTLVTRTGPELKLTNPEFRGEMCVESLYVLLLIILRSIASALPEYKTVAPQFPRPQLGRKTRSSQDITLVLDLDETLIFSACEPAGEDSHILTLEENSVLYKVSPGNYKS